MKVRAVDPKRSQIILLGTPYYADDALSDLPEVANNVADLAAVFTNPEIGGFPPEHCIVLPGRATTAEIGDALYYASATAEDLLLFYFAGHGLIGPNGDLYLGLHGTRQHNPIFSALRFEAIRNTFSEPSTRAANRAVIIDSCFSGRAIVPHLGTGTRELVGMLGLPPQK